MRKFAQFHCWAGMLVGLMVSGLVVPVACGQTGNFYSSGPSSGEQVPRFRASGVPADQRAAGQPRYVPPLKFDGWIASRPQPADRSGAPQERASYFQQFSDLPDLNSLNLSNNDFSAPLPAYAQREPNDGGMPNMLGNSLQPAAVNDPRTMSNEPRMSGNDSRIYNMDPRQPGNPNFDHRQGYDTRDRFGNVLPPILGATPAQLAAFQNGGTGLVPEHNRNLGNQLPTQYATGLPYVTPAPNQRYPTSPYLGARLYPTNYVQVTPAAYVAQQPGVPGSVLPQPLPGNPQPIYSTPGAYPAATGNCAPTLPPGGAYVPPTVPPDWNPSMYSTNNSGYRPLISLGQENYNVVLGRGILGQPTAYVPGQYVRNFLRYIFP